MTVFFWAMLILIGMVVADFFAPVLPSATLVTAAAGLVFGNPLLIGVLLVGAAVASWLGEFLGYRLFRTVRTGLARRSPRAVRGRITGAVVKGTIAKLEALLRVTISDHPYRTTMVARFLPAGRTALAWAAAGTAKPPYARMAALGGALWAVYSVSLGLVIAWIAGPGLQSLVGSVVTMAAVGLFLGWLARRWQRTHPDQPAADPGAAVLAIAAAPDTTSIVGPDVRAPASDNGTPPAHGTARAALRPGGISHVTHDRARPAPTPAGPFATVNTVTPEHSRPAPPARTRRTGLPRGPGVDSVCQRDFTAANLRTA